MKSIVTILMGVIFLCLSSVAQVHQVPLTGEFLAAEVYMEKPSNSSNPLDDWPWLGFLDIAVPSPTGLAWDDQYLYVPNWSAGSPEVYIYKIDISSGATVGTIPSPSLWPGGITWDGSHFWVVDYDAGMFSGEDWY